MFFPRRAFAPASLSQQHEAAQRWCRSKRHQNTRHRLTPDALLSYLRARWCADICTLKATEPPAHAHALTSRLYNIPLSACQYLRAKMSRLESSAGPSGSTSPPLAPASPQVGGGETPTSRLRSSTEDSHYGAEPGSAQEQRRTYSSDREEGYPSWLPKRPPPPAPASTYHSSVMREGLDVGADDRTPSDSVNRGDFYGVGRRPTPRSVRIVSLGTEHSQTPQKGRQRHPTDLSRASYGPHARVWSRGTAMSPTVISAASGFPMPPVRPRFNAPALHLEFLTSPSPWTRLRFYLYPLFVFAHIPLQTFFDFNAVFILLQ